MATCPTCGHPQLTERPHVHPSEAAAIVARAKGDLAAPPCSNCGHPFMEHTGRSLFSMHKEPVRGRMCEHRMDYHHTCACPHYFQPEPVA